MGVFGVTPHASPLASQLEARTRDLDWTLANYAFVTNVTALASECDIAHSPTMSVASCRVLPTLGLTFVGESAELLSTYTAFLADPGSEVQLLVNEDQRDVVERAFSVMSVAPRWQMLYHGTLADLDRNSAAYPEGPRSRHVEALANSDLAAVQALAEAEAISLPIMLGDPFQQGPAYGIWDRRRLIAMGLTAACLPGAAQVDAVVTRKEFRHQGYATAVMAALLQAHLKQRRSVFAVVDQDNVAALSLLEKLGFVRERPIYAMRCLLEDSEDAD